MAVPTYQFQRVLANGALGPFLNDYEGFTFSTIQNQPCSLSLKYPTAGFGRAVQLSDEDDFHEVAVKVNNSEMRGGRILLDTRNRSLYDADGVREYVGASILSELNFVNLWTGLTDKDKIYSAQTPGYVMNDLLATSLANNTGTPLWSWSNPATIATVDARGEAWGITTSPTLTRGYSLMRLLGDLIEEGAVWVTTQGRQVSVYRRDPGADRTVGANQVKLIYGREIKDGAEKVSSKDLITHFIGKAETSPADPNDWLQLFDSDARIRIGRYREITEDFGKISGGQLFRNVEAALSERSVRRREVSLELTFEGSSKYFPGIHFDEGDWVWVDLGGKNLERAKVVQYSLEIGERGRVGRASATLFNYLVPLELTNDQLLRKMRYGRVRLPPA